MAESTSKLRAQVAALTNVSGKGGFDIMQDEDTFKSVYDIMLGISKVWDDMTDVKQSALLELIAGKVRSNQVAALLNNMSRAEEILHTSENSEGTMEEVHARWLDSIAAKQAQMTASWENLSQTMVNSDLVKWFYDFGNGAISALDQVMSKLGSFGAVFAAGGTALFGSIGRQMNDGRGNALTGLVNTLTDFRGRKTGQVSGQFISAYNDVYGKTLDQQQAVAAATEAVGRNMNEAEMFAVKYSKGLITVGENSTIAGMKLQALGGVFKSVMASMATGLILAGVSAAVTWAMGEWDKAANAEQYAVQAADDANASYKEAQDQVKSLESELSSLEAQYQALIDKGPLNFADEQTKADLKEQTEELRTQLAIAKQIEAERGKSAYDLNKQAWEKQYTVDQSIPARLKDIDTVRDGRQLVEDTRDSISYMYDQYMQDAGDAVDEVTRRAIVNLSEDFTNGVIGVADQAKKYVEKDYVGNDVLGAVAMYKYLQESQDRIAGEIEYWKKRPQDEDAGYGMTAREIIDDYDDMLDHASSATAELKRSLLSTYNELDKNLDQMVTNGDTRIDLYQRMMNLRNEIGESVIPYIHDEKKLLELRKNNKQFGDTYDNLAEMAKSTEITVDTLNDQKYDAFRAELDKNGISIENFIGYMNQLRDVKAPNLSTATSSGFQDNILKLLGHQATGASIMKSTGYGTNGISEDDYQKLVDMNDLDFLKAVESSHGTMWFNQAKFNEILTKKIVQQQDKMYSDMGAKQAEYVKKTQELNKLLRDEQIARRDSNKKELKDLQARIASTVKEMNTLQTEVALYNRLNAQIKTATSSYSKWQNAKGGPQEGDDYDEALEAYKALQEGAKSGRVGNADYKAAQEYLLGTGANYIGDKAQRALLKRYLTKSAPGSDKDTGYGARQFQNDLINKYGILDKKGRLNANWTVEDIAKKVGIGPDLVKHLFGELNEFISDESQKYQLSSKTMEEEVNYSEYAKASAEFKDAVAAYDKNAGEKEYRGLIEAWKKYNNFNERYGIDTKDVANEQLRASNDELASATRDNTAMLGFLAAVIASLNLPEGAERPGVGIDASDSDFHLYDKNGNFINGADGKPIRGVTNIIDYLSGITEKFGNSITKLMDEIDYINANAEKSGIKKKLEYDSTKEKFVVSDLEGKNAAYFDTLADATLDMYGDTADKAKKLATEITAIAASFGINKTMGYNGENRKWNLTDSEGKVTEYEHVEEAMVAIFSDYVASNAANAEGIKTFIDNLKNGDVKIDLSSSTLGADITALISTSLEKSGGKFGEAAITAWNEKLTDAGIKKALGIDENGDITYGGEKRGSLLDALTAAMGDIFTANSKYGKEYAIEQAKDTINRTLIANGIKGYAEYNANRTDGKPYEIYDEKGGVVGAFASDAEAINAISAKNVSALADAYRQFNEQLQKAGSTIRATIEQGQTTITDTATNEKKTYTDLATATGEQIAIAAGNLNSVNDQINGIISEFTDAGMQASTVRESLNRLRDIFDSGAQGAGKSLDYLNRILSENNIKESLGITEDGKFSFGEQIFNTIDEAIAAAFSGITASPKQAEAVVNNLLQKLGENDKLFKYDDFDKRYKLYNPETGEEFGDYANATEAIAALTGSSINYIADCIAAVNEAYKNAGEDMRVSIENGQAIVKNLKGEIIKTYNDVDEALGSEVKIAADALASVLSSIEQISVKVEMDGAEVKFQLVGADGKPIEGQSFTNYTDALTAALDGKFSTLDNVMSTLNNIVDKINVGDDKDIDIKNGKFVTKEGAKELVHEEIGTALNSAMETVLASTITETMKSIMGSAVDIIKDNDGNTKLKFNGNIYDTFVSMMKEGWDAKVFSEYSEQVQKANADAKAAAEKAKEAADAASNAFVGAAEKDTGAFNSNETAVNSATKALSAFNAELAASSLNKMLEHTGKEGSFAAGQDGQILYYDQMGIQRGIFKDLDSVYQMIFGDYDQWQLRRDEKTGQYEAYKQRKDANGEVIDEYVEAIGKITSARLGEDGVLTLNDYLRMPLEGMHLDAGKLEIQAGGQAIEIGNISGINASNGGTSDFLDKNGNVVFSASGALTMGKNSTGFIQRPSYHETTAFVESRLAGMTAANMSDADKNMINSLLRFASAAEGNKQELDAQATYIIDQLGQLIDNDRTGELYDAFGQYAAHFGFTDSARQQRLVEEAEAAFKKQYEESDISKLRRAYQSGEITLDEARKHASTLYDLDKLPYTIDALLRDKRYAENLVRMGESQYKNGYDLTYSPTGTGRGGNLTFDDMLASILSERKAIEDRKKAKELLAQQPINEDASAYGFDNEIEFLDRLYDLGKAAEDMGLGSKSEALSALRGISGDSDALSALQTLDKYRRIGVSVDDAVNAQAKHDIELERARQEISQMKADRLQAIREREAAEAQAAREAEANEKAEMVRQRNNRAMYGTNINALDKVYDFGKIIEDAAKTGNILNPSDFEAIRDYLINLPGLDSEKYRTGKSPEEANKEYQAEVDEIEAERQAEIDRLNAERAAANKKMSDDSAEALGILGNEVAQRLSNGVEPFVKRANEAWDKASEVMGDLSDQTQKQREETTKTVTDLSNKAAEGIAGAWYGIEDAATHVWDFFTKPVEPEKPKPEQPKPKYEGGTLTTPSGGNSMSYYQRGNVDLFNRKLIPTQMLGMAGWGDVGQGIATLYSSSYQEQIDGEDYILHITPILPDGTVLSPEELDSYVQRLFDTRNETGINILSLDNPANGYDGLGLGLVTWLQQVVGDIEEARRQADEFDRELSQEQSEYYKTDTAKSIIDSLENLPDEVDYDQAFGNAVEYIKTLYDFDRIRKELPGYADADDEHVARGLYGIGDKAEDYRREVEETPVEVDVEADTSNAKSQMDADLSNRKYTATVNITYNDPGFSPPGGTDAPMTSGVMSATGTSNAVGGTSLVDEAGAELIEHVSRGTYELGTDNGPRFTRLDKGDIVHTAEETKKIKRRGLLGRISDAFRNGGVKTGGAFRDSYAAEMGSAAGLKKSDVILVQNSGALPEKGLDLITGGKSKKKSAAAKMKDALKWAEKFVDWIPTALDILKKKTTDFIKAAEKSIGYLAQNKELTNAIANVREEIDLNNQAVERYKKQANDFAKRAGLSSSIVKLIQEGAIDIKQYDETTRKAIQTYQTWWEKAKGCLDTIEALNDQMYDLGKQKLDNIVTYFGNIDDMLNEQIKTFNSLNEVKEAYGQEMKRSDYLDAIRLTQDVIENLSAEQEALNNELEEQVNSGVIKVGSDDWYNYAKQIEELNSTLSEAKIDLSKLNDEVKNIALNNLSTSIYYLDNLQSKIEGLQQLRSAQGSRDEVNSYRTLISTGMEQIDNLRTQNYELEKQLEGLDVLSEKYQEINNQIQDNEDKIMDIKASQEEWNDAILDLKIELLQKQNQKYQERLDLMKALNDLEDARQRRVLMYNNQTGFGYVQDEDAVEEAQDAVNDQMYNLIVNGLEAQKENNNIYDNMGNQLIPVQDMLSSVDFTRYYDSINRGSENSTLLTNILKSIDLPSILEGTKGGDVSIDIGDIILNGVNDAEALGDAIIAQLPGYLVQAIYSKGS